MLAVITSKTKMMPIGGSMKVLLIMCFLLSPIVSASVTKEKDVSIFTWGGVSAYIAVNRNKVQTRLNDIYQSRPGAPQLFVPEDPVLPNLLTEGQHIVYIDFGFVSPEDVTVDPSIASLSREISVAIPFLSTTPKGAPNYAMAIAKMYDIGLNVTDVFITQPIYQYTRVEKVDIMGSEASMKDQTEAIHITFNQTHPCQKSPVRLRNEFNDFLLNNNIFGSSDPDLEFCNRHPKMSESQYCQTMDDIKENFQNDIPKLCAKHTLATNPEENFPCEVSLAVDAITPGLRGLLLLDPTDTIQVVAAEQYIKKFAFSLRYPCTP